MKEIRSGATSDLTSPGLSELRDLIINASDQRNAAERIISDARQALEKKEKAVLDAQWLQDEAEQRLARLEASWFRSIRGGAIAATTKKLEQLTRTTIDAKKQFDELRAGKYAAEQHRDSLWLNTEFDLSGPAHDAWSKLAEAFAVLSSSQGIWDITSYREKRRGEGRSAATKVLERKSIQLALSELPIIESQYEALRWQNANGEGLFLYPGFMVVFRDQASFAMLDLNEVECVFEGQRFEENEITPTDAKQVGTWWVYAKRDGSPDLRYADNMQKPIYLYAEIHWKSATGLSEAYLFSNAQAAARFVDALKDFRNALQRSQASAILDRIDVRMSNFKAEPGTTIWNFDTDIRCRTCGGILSAPDNHTDSSAVSCKGCGMGIGTYGDLVAALKLKGQEELRKRGLA